MNCEELEQQIYLYRELSAAEQSLIDSHVATCAACRDLLASIQRQYAFVREAALDKPVVQNSQSFTDTMMEALGPDRSRVIFLDNPWLRYSAVAASVVLIMFFLFEAPWRQPQLPQQTAVVLPQAPAPVMDTRVFIENQQQRRRTPEQSLFTTYADCLKRDECESEIVRHFKNKMKL